MQSHPLHVYNNKVMIEELLSTYNKACRVSNEASQLVVSCRHTHISRNVWQLNLKTNSMKPLYNLTLDLTYGYLPAEQMLIVT